MLGQHRRRWPNIKLALVKCFGHTGNEPILADETQRTTYCWDNVAPTYKTLGRHCTIVCVSLKIRNRREVKFWPYSRNWLHITVPSISWKQISWFFLDEFSKFHDAGIGQIHQSHQARDRKGGISHQKATIANLNPYYSVNMSSGYEKSNRLHITTTTFSFGEVNMIKFPDFSLI